MVDNISDQDRIERDLERTRSRMDSRLTELQARLSPGQIVDDLMGYFRGSEGGDFARNLMASVRSNPLPAALTGIGLTWLMASNPRPQPSQGGGKELTPGILGSSRVRVSSPPGSPRWASHEDLDLHLRNVEQSVVRQADEAEDTHRSRLDEARGKALGIARQAHDTAESFGQRVTDTLDSAKQSISQGAQGLRDRAGDATDQIGGYAQSVSDQVTRGGHAASETGGKLFATITNSPVLLGAISLGVGALLGALVPQSDQEEAALSGIAGETRAAARTLAQDAIDRGGQATQKVLDVGRESARSHGLMGDKTIGTLVDEATTGDLVGHVKQVAQDVLKAGDDGLRKQDADQSEAALDRSASTSSGAAPSA